MTRTETYKLFHLYAKKWGFKDWEDLVANVTTSTGVEGITNHTLNLMEYIDEYKKKNNE